MHLIWGHIWRHTSEKSRTNASNVIMLSLRQAISVDIWKCTVEKKSHKCKQCDYAFSQAGNLRKHLKSHSREKSNKCDQCDYASYHTGHLRTHLKMHNWEKSRKRNHIASSHANNWRCFWKIKVQRLCINPSWQFEEKFGEKNQTSTTCATSHQYKLTIWGGTLKRTIKKYQTSATISISTINT